MFKDIYLEVTWLYLSLFIFGFDITLLILFFNNISRVA
jgi:hypothetical protein